MAAVIFNYLGYGPLIFKDGNIFNKGVRVICVAGCRPCQLVILNLVKPSFMSP